MRPIRPFPPPPRGLKGRDAELTTLARAIEHAAPTRIALVGTGGSGKSMLAAALGHRLKARFGGRIDWFRVGAWDFRTLGEMLALRYGTTRERSEMVPALRAFLTRGGERLVVLDNHEDDAAMARLLDALAGTKATFVITARRCLLAGVLAFPVTAPLVTAGKSAFPRVARLTRVLRWNPLALDVADAIVASGAASVRALEAFLVEGGVERVCVIAHEDDLPEVSLLVDWAWPQLAPESRRVLAILAYVEGDHVAMASLAHLAALGKRAAQAMEPLVKWHLVQEPVQGRYALHAVVRYAVRKRTKVDAARIFEHYVALLEAHPAQLVMEQTNLFAAMDHAHRAGDLHGMLRIEDLLAKLDDRR